jgi:hypothetical protein
MQQGGKALKPKTKTNAAVDFNRILKVMSRSTAVFLLMILLISIEY